MVFQQHRCLVFLLLFTANYLHAKNDSTQLKNSIAIIKNQTGWFSVGVRTTMNVFSHDGFGVGAGGQFRLQLSNRVNTDWFADYISVNHHGVARSEYVHIGWSVLFYPVKKWQYPKYKAQLFILAGHCFDFNKMTVLSAPEVSRHRWGAAVQMGFGFALSFIRTYRFNIDAAVYDASHKRITS